MTMRSMRRLRTIIPGPAPMDVETVLQQFELKQGPYIQRIDISLLYEIKVSSSFCCRCYFDVISIQRRETRKFSIIYKALSRCKSLFCLWITSQNYLHCYLLLIFIYKCKYLGEGEIEMFMNFLHEKSSIIKVEIIQDLVRATAQTEIIFVLIIFWQAEWRFWQIAQNSLTTARFNHLLQYQCDAQQSTRTATFEREARAKCQFEQSDRKSKPLYPPLMFKHSRPLNSAIKACGWKRFVSSWKFYFKDSGVREFECDNSSQWSPLSNENYN